METSLFPKREEWGTGDEALDVKLSAMLNKTVENLNLKSIEEFYLVSLQIKTRAYNPSFHVTIELLVKALLFYFSPETPVNFLMLKLKGQYGHKTKKNFEWIDRDDVLLQLQSKKNVRYQGQLDFSILTPELVERNPFVRTLIQRSPFELHAKIIFKDFKNYLAGFGKSDVYQNHFFRELRENQNILVIDQFAEIWFHDGMIHALPLFSLKN